MHISIHKTFYDTTDLLISCHQHSTCLRDRRHTLAKYHNNKVRGPPEIDDGFTMCVWTEYQCPKCRQNHYALERKPCFKAKTDSDACNINVGNERAPPDRYSRHCKHCASLDTPREYYDAITGTLVAPTTIVPAVKIGPAGHLIYWHFNFVPELDLISFRKLSWEDRYVRACQQAPGCLDVLPFEQEDQYCNRVGALVPAAINQLAQVYVEWFANSV